MSQAPAAVAETQTADAVETPPERPATPTRAVPETSRARAAPAAPQRDSRARLDRPAAYNYVGAEVRRILIMSGILTAVLIVLAIFV